MNANSPKLVFVGNSEMARLMRLYDWSQTSLGSPAQWPQSLKTSVSILLNSRYPMFVWWGPEYVNLYNDAYRPILGASKHPQFLGQSAKDCWAEVWDVVGPLADSVLATGQPTWSENLLLMMERNGYAEEAYFTFSYSPVQDEDGGVGGIFCAMTETTQQIIGERRLRTLRDLSANTVTAKTVTAKTVEAACHQATAILSTNAYDIPFALLYRVEPNGQAHLVGTTASLEPGTIASPKQVDLTQESDFWHLSRVNQTGTAERVEDLTRHWGELPGGAWSESADAAWVMPLAQSGPAQQLAGFLVLGISPRREWDDEYRRFFDLVGSQITTAIANAQAYEEERLKLAQLQREATQREQALRQEAEIAQQKVETILASISDGFYTLDHHWRYTYVNDRYCEMGKPREEMLGQNIWQVFPDVVNTDFYRQLQRVMTERVSVQFEYLYAPWNRWYEHRVYPSPDGLTVLIAEITDRKQAEAALRQSEEQFRQLADAMPQIVWIADAAGNPEYVSQRWVEYTGLTLEQTANQNWIGQVIHPQDLEPTYAVWQGCLETGSLYQTEFRLKAAADPSDHAYRWFLCRAVPIHNPQGQITHWYGTLTDLHEHKQAEEARAAAEQRYRIVSDLIPFGMWEADLQGQAIYLSQSFLEMTGQTLEEHRQSWHSLLHPDDRQPTLAAWSNCLQTGHLWEHEFRIRGQDGQYRTILARGLPVRNTAGDITSYVGANYDITERKQAEVAIRQSEARAQLAIKVAQLGTWRYNLQTNVVELDQRMQEIWGELNQAKVIPLSVVINRIHPDDQARVTAAIRAALDPQSSGSYALDYRIVWDDGTERWISANGQVQFVGEGELRQPIDFLGTALDITERKQTETALAAQEQRYRYIFEAVNAPIWEEDFSEVKAAIEQLKTSGVQDFRQYFAAHPEFVQQAVDLVRLRDVNQAGLRMFKAEDKTELLTSLHQIFVPETQDIFVGELLAIAAEESFFTAETMLQTLQGDHIDVWVTITFPASASYDRVLVSLLDITERKQAETALRESERRFRRLVESNMFGVAFGDFTGGIHYVNEYFLNMVGYSREELETGQVRWIDITPPEYLPLDERAGIELRTQGVAVPFEKEYIRKDGRRVPILIGAALLNEPYDQQQEIIAFYLNLTERKQAEAEREQLLAREQAAREAAEAANRIKDEFLAVVSHELRSPLNPILGWSKLLRHRQLDDQKAQRALEVIERNAQMQAQLINDLLDVSRILRGKLSLDIQPVDLAATIQAALETVRLAAEAKSIEIHTHFAPNLGPVAGDPGRLQQVIWNLLSNAVKFTPEGGQVEVQLTPIPPATPPHPHTPHPTPHTPTPPLHSPSAQITITDTGKGIPADFLPHVFEQFRQESSATTRRFGGLGLGLAIVRYLVELHGGSVEATSLGEGQGASFSVTLPLLKPQPSPPPAQPSSPPPPPRSLSGSRILVVDDDDNTREFLAFLLELHGANVIAVATAAEALPTLSQFQPDILLSDIGMPDVDGYMLMRQVRALPVEQGGQIPAIALTAYAGEIDHQQAMAAGFQCHLTKPIEPDVLIQTIAEFIAQLREGSRELSLHQQENPS